MKRAVGVGALLAAALGGVGPTAVRAEEPTVGTVAPAVSDAAIAKDIQGRLAANADFSQSNVTISSHDGVVTLAGIFTSVELRQRALELARSTSGVVRVDDQTRVRSIGSTPADPEVPLR